MCTQNFELQYIYTYTVYVLFFIICKAPYLMLSNKYCTLCFFLYVF